MNINQLMKQAQQMQKKLAEAQAAVELIEVEGTSGSGAVSIKLGKKASDLKIDPKLIDPNDPEMLADLILAAINNALTKKEDETAAKMGAATGNMNLPAGFKLPF